VGKEAKGSNPVGELVGWWTPRFSFRSFLFFALEQQHGP
jgi:hypothetical protein